MIRAARSMRVAGGKEDKLAQIALADPVYVLGHSAAETRRLMLQARLYDRITRRFLADAGLTAGMSVLDVGSGAGDVAFAAADLVGPSGVVVGIDRDPAVLEIASARARAERRENVRFVVGDCRSAMLPHDFDAAVGRLVLMYTGDVTEALRAIVEHVKPGGIVAFAEAEFATAVDYQRAAGSSLNRSLWEWATHAFTVAGAHTAMAGPLYRAFVAAGLEAPRMTMQVPLGGGADWPGYDWITASMHSLLPALEEAGIVSAEMLDVDTLAARSRAEVAETGIPFMTLPLVMAWARKPRGAADPGDPSCITEQGDRP
jgi:ubiquinone/menaquinone biosynthesis C-methylase UbiE